MLHPDTDDYDIRIIRMFALLLRYQDTYHLSHCVLLNTCMCTYACVCMYNANRNFCVYSACDSIIPYICNIYVYAVYYVHTVHNIQEIRT